MDKKNNFVHVKQPFEAQLIHDATEQPSDEVYVPPYCESTCTDSQLFLAIDARYEQLMRDTGNNPYIIFMAFSEYLYERYSVDPEDLEFMFAVFHYSRDDAIKQAANTAMSVATPAIAENVIKQMIETYGPNRDTEPDVE